MRNITDVGGKRQLAERRVQGGSFLTNSQHMRSEEQSRIIYNHLVREVYVCMCGGGGDAMMSCVVAECGELWCCVGACQG